MGCTVIIIIYFDDQIMSSLASGNHFKLSSASYIFLLNNTHLLAHSSEVWHDMTGFFAELFYQRLWGKSTCKLICVIG